MKQRVNVEKIYIPSFPTYSFFNRWLFSGTISDNFQKKNWSEVLRKKSGEFSKVHLLQEPFLLQDQNISHHYNINGTFVMCLDFMNVAGSNPLEDRQRVPKGSSTIAEIHNRLHPVHHCEQICIVDSLNKCHFCWSKIASTFSWETNIQISIDLFNFTPEYFLGAVIDFQHSYRPLYFEFDFSKWPFLSISDRGKLTWNFKAVKMISPSNFERKVAYQWLAERGFAARSSCRWRLRPVACTKMTGSSLPEGGSPGSENDRLENEWFTIQVDLCHVNIVLSHEIRDHC